MDNNISPVPPSSLMPLTPHVYSGIKIATSNLFVFDEAAVPISSMADMVFEDLGGHELIDITRSDLAYDIQTDTAPNQPISNLSSLTQRYSPKNLVGLQNTIDRYFATFPINLEDYVPQDGANIKFDGNGTNADPIDNLIIEVANIDTANRYVVEVEIMSYENKY